MEDNSHAGQGPVVLDIGGDIGALILNASAALDGAEIEARPVSGAAKATFDASSHVHHAHGGHAHSHDGALVHVAVVGRPVGGKIVHSAVFSELQDGVYELYVRPDGPVRLTATVRGAEVTMHDWPSA